MRFLLSLFLTTCIITGCSAETAALAPILEINKDIFEFRFDSGNRFRGKLYKNNILLDAEQTLSVSSHTILSALNTKEGVIIRESFLAEVGCHDIFYSVQGNSLIKILMLETCSGTPNVVSQTISDGMRKEIMTRRNDFVEFLWQDGKRKFTQECLQAFNNYNFLLKEIDKINECMLSMPPLTDEQLAQIRKREWSKNLNELFQSCADAGLYPVYMNLSDDGKATCQSVNYLGELGDYDKVQGNEAFIRSACERKDSIRNIDDFCKDYPK